MRRRGRARLSIDDRIVVLTCLTITGATIATWCSWTLSTPIGGAA